MSIIRDEKVLPKSLLHNIDLIKIVFGSKHLFTFANPTNTFILSYHKPPQIYFYYKDNIYYPITETEFDVLKGVKLRLSFVDVNNALIIGYMRLMMPYRKNDLYFNLKYKNPFSEEFKSLCVKSLYIIDSMFGGLDGAIVDYKRRNGYGFFYNRKKIIKTYNQNLINFYKEHI